MVFMLFYIEIPKYRITVIITSQTEIRMLLHQYVKKLMNKTALHVGAKISNKTKLIEDVESILVLYYLDV